jgi:hypothetical protein
MWWHVPVISATVGSISRKIMIQSMDKKEKPISKVTRARRAGGVA